MSDTPVNFVNNEYNERRPEERGGHRVFGLSEGRQAPPVDPKQQGYGVRNDVLPHPIISEAPGASTDKNVTAAAHNDPNAEKNAEDSGNAPALNPTQAAQKQATLAAAASAVPAPTACK